MEAWAPADDAAMARVAASRDVMLRAEAKAAATHRVEAHARVAARAAPRAAAAAARERLLRRRDGGGGRRGRARPAAGGAGALRRGFERAQRTAALALWRVAGLELRRAEARVAYARHAGAQKLGRFRARCRRRGATRCLHKWVSRTGWAIFFERAAGALRVRRRATAARAARFVAAHDANPLYAFAAVALGEARAAADCAFRLDDRVRAERREMWFAATVIQARQRRNEWRGYYLLALRAATVFVALYRMWPVRRRYARASATPRSASRPSAHMFLARRPFLRARGAARTVARTVRGHLGRLRAAGRARGAAARARGRRRRAADGAAPLARLPRARGRRRAQARAREGGALRAAAPVRLVPQPRRVHDVPAAGVPPDDGRGRQGAREAHAALHARQGRDARQEAPRRAPRARRQRRRAARPGRVAALRLARLRHAAAAPSGPAARSGAS